MGLKRALVSVLFVACTPASQPTTQTVDVKDASATPIATTSASTPPAETRRNGPTLKATAAMKMDGTLDDKQIVEEANKDAVGLQQCAVAVRATDSHTGSLNLQVTVNANGEAAGDLKSPANDDAKKCILDLVKKWKVKGTGKAMVLLSFQN